MVEDAKQTNNKQTNNNKNQTKGYGDQVRVLLDALTLA